MMGRLMLQAPPLRGRMPYDDDYYPFNEVKFH